MEQSNCPKEADWSQIANDIEHPAIIISACRRSGKTFLTRDILHTMCKVSKPDVAILFSETSNFNDSYDFIPDKFKYNKFDQEKVSQFIEEQEKIMKQYKSRQKKRCCKEDPPSILMIFDDVAHDRTVFHSPTLGKLFILGRHIRISVIFLTQHLHALSPKMRNNADVICVFRDPNIHNRKVLEDQFCTLSISQKKLTQSYLDSCLGEAYRCIVVCMYKVQEADGLDDYIYTYKASKDIPKYRLGQKMFWSDSRGCAKGGSKKTLKLDDDYEKQFNKKYGEKILY